jgi:hypothetical protein
MSLTNKQKVFLGLYSAWTTLGCRRGYLQYKYKNEQQMKRYLEDKNANKSYVTKPEPFYYTNAALESFFSGGIVYVNPFFLPWTIFKELKRLEINLRNLEEEKNSSSYYEVF